MYFEKVHCFFEQSGTFKKTFQELGFPAFSYDIENTENVDFNVNLFNEIKSEITTHNSEIFKNIKSNDLVFAFFPCTYFSDQSQLLSRGDSFGQSKWSKEQKLKYSLNQMERRTEFYKYLCNLCIIAINKGFKLIIENPYGKVNFLKHFFPLKPGIIIKDRSEYGDFYKKPTQFFFINCEPEYKLLNEYDYKIIKNKIIKNEYGFARSIISKEFAKNFIKDFVID